jgi:glycosyltransferase involved in cell wall biosynthesis
LFVKERLAWPRSSGHDVHCFYSMQALAKQGHTVALATLHDLDPHAVEDCGLTELYSLKSPVPGDPPPDVHIRFSKMQAKFRSFWGIEEEAILRVGQLAARFRADAVVVVGLNVLPYLGAVDRAVRIWYAADEWVWHHLSLVKLTDVSSWGELKQAAIKGWYERAYAPLLDRVWMVSTSDERAIRWVAGVKAVDVLPNGVDVNYYQPSHVEETPRSCVFWGRLDFGPNVQALKWFGRKVWPQVRAAVPDAQLTIYGFQPTAPVMRLAAELAGVQVIPDLPDLRSEIAKHALVVLPFVSGWGIKNKLLEAAAMGKAVVCTPRTAKGLVAGDALVQAGRPAEWVKVLKSLWDDSPRRAALGLAARAWVEREHTWDAVARNAARGIEASLAQRSAG